MEQIIKALKIIMKTQLLVIRQKDKNGYGVVIKPLKPYVISPSLVKEVSSFQYQIIDEYMKKPWSGTCHIIWCCHKSNITIKGLDFHFIYNCMAKNNIDAIEKYINQVFDCMYLNHIGLGIPLVNCSVVDRPTTSMIREFFYMNQINFIKNCDMAIDRPSTKINEYDILSMGNKLHFPKWIYLKNKYYNYHHVDIHAMREKLVAYENQTYSNEYITKIRIEFDKMCNKTVWKILNLSKTNLNILKKFSDNQKREYLNIQNK